MKEDIDVAAILYKAADAIRYYERISILPDCNTCIKRNCEYRPKLGSSTRINCPHWTGEK